MGSAQSLVTSETAVTGAVVATAAAAYFITRNSPTSTVEQATGTIPGGIQEKKLGAKKSKKKKATSGVASDAGPGTGMEGSTVLVERLPGGIVDDETPAASASEAAPKPAKKRKGKKAGTPAADADSSKVAPAPAQQPPVAGPSSGKKVPPPTATFDNDGPWTRVESRRRTSDKNVPAASAGSAMESSDAGIGTSVTEVTEEEGSVAAEQQEDKKKTLAEKLLPKPPRTAVDDMLETPQHPELARVMRIQPGPDDKPASGFNWGDYEDVEEVKGADADGEEDEGGWGVVKSKSKAKLPRNPASSTGATTSSSAKAPETLTKKQRQNAAKRDAQKAAKADAEAERLAKLAAHKREVDKQRIAEQYSKGASGSNPKVGGGMSASLDGKGALVWD